MNWMNQLFSMLGPVGQITGGALTIAEAEADHQAAQTAREDAVNQYRAEKRVTDKDSLEAQISAMFRSAGTASGGGASQIANRTKFMNDQRHMALQSALAHQRREAAKARLGGVLSGTGDVTKGTIDLVRTSLSMGAGGPGGGMTTASAMGPRASDVGAQWNSRLESAGTMNFFRPKGN